MTLHHEEHQLQHLQEGVVSLTLTFPAIDVHLLPLVGGKGANLGELTRAGFPVPEGFCVTTAAYDLISQAAGLLRGKLVGFALGRMRALMGLREVPKFELARLLSLARRLLLSVGEELVRAGRLEVVEDLFFLTLAEAHEAVAGKEIRAVVREHRASYARELRWQHIPRILLSD